MDDIFVMRSCGNYCAFMPTVSTHEVAGLTDLGQGCGREPTSVDHRWFTVFIFTNLLRDL